jgi:hypothetical protein
MARVWAESRHSGTHLLMLLAIADFADDDGRAYPAVSTLADKCRMQPRNANVILAALRASGELEVKVGHGPRGTNLYRVKLSPQGMQSLAGVQERAGVQSLADTPAKACSPPCKGLPETPASLCTQTINEPSVNHHEPKRVRAKRAARAPVKCSIPDDFGVSERVKAWAASKGFDRLEEHCEAFVIKARAKGYTYANWDDGFMGAIRDDWAGLRAAPSRVVGDKERRAANARENAEAMRLLGGRAGFASKDYRAGDGDDGLIPG